jgi:hypothetical protein
MAELELLDWKAVDLERKFIEIRAGQAKTASRSWHLSSLWSAQSERIRVH